MNICGLTTENYRQQLQALLPRGLAWPRKLTATLTRLLHAIADECYRLNGRACVLLDEADPRTTTELLSDWERNFGLPNPCTDAADTLEERRLDLHGKVTAIGDQSRQYFIDRAADMGYPITITEFRPFTFGSNFGEALNSEEWRFAWQVNAAEENITYFNFGSACNEPLADWGNERLECMITRLKPAHTTVLFAYGG